MPRFRFNLEGVLSYRRHLERNRQIELAEAIAQMLPLEEKMAQIKRAVEEAHADLRRNRLVGRLDMAFLAAHRRFIVSMQQKAVALAQQMQTVQKLIDQRRAALVEAGRDRKVMEKLREKHQARWREEEDRREAGQFDEIGMQLNYQRLAEAGAPQEHTSGEAA